MDFLCSFSVFAACSDLDGEGAKELRGHHSKKIRVIEMDVTSEESVKTAAFHVKRFLDQVRLPEPDLAFVLHKEINQPH